MKKSHIALLVCILVSFLVWRSNASYFVKGFMMCIIAVAEWLIRECDKKDDVLYWLQSIILIFAGVIGGLYLFAGVLSKLIAI